MSIWRRETLGEREGDPLEANPIRRREGGGGETPWGESHPFLIGEGEPPMVQSPFSWASGVSVNRIWVCECDFRENSSLGEGNPRERGPRLRLCASLETNQSESVLVNGNCDEDDR